MGRVMIDEPSELDEANEVDVVKRAEKWSWIPMELIGRSGMNCNAFIGE